MTRAITIEDLVKTFGHVTALDGATLSVESGEVHGFLGPNGAGKTTTIRVLLGLLRADSGDVRPLGGVDQRRGDTLCERFDLDPTKKGRTYSKGNRQKVAIVAALASDVELLVLDEPTAGLDPLMETVFREAIGEEMARGATVFLSSHILAQVEQLCDRISIIRQGRIVESGTLGQLRHLTRTTIIARTSRSASGLADLSGVHDLVIDDGQVSFDVDSEQLDTAIGQLHALGIQALTSHPPTLEQLFMRHYGEDLETAGTRR